MKSRKAKYLGEILIAKKIITSNQLQEVLLAQKGSSLRLGEILIKKNMVTEANILQSLAEYYNIKNSMHLTFNDPENLFKNIPIHFLNKNKIVPFNIESKISVSLLFLTIFTLPSFII